MCKLSSGLIIIQLSFHFMGGPYKQPHNWQDEHVYQPQKVEIG